MDASDSKRQDLKQQLLDCLDKEARQFSESARNYFTKDVLSSEDRVGLLNAVINTVDHVISAGDWESSLFLRNTLKPLLQIKTEALAELSHLRKSSSQKSYQVQAPSEQEGAVYISLFQSDGYNISKWAMQLRSLDRYIVGRPIYQNETDIEKRIRLRASNGSEAYVTLIVNKAAISTSDSLKDPFDHPLVLLKEGAVRNGRIVAFVHQNVRYHYVDGQLVK